MAAALAAAFICLVALVLIIRFRTDQLLFPPVPGTSAAAIEDSIGAGHGSTSRMLLRGYGANRAGCIVFFPGQHGGIANYEKTFFPSLVSQGIKVFAASYAGQDGAPGRSDVARVNAQASEAVRFVSNQCGADHTVVVGRSLGTMVAAYSLRSAHPAGLVLVSAAPSLSAAFFAQLDAHWYTRPLRVLPAGVLVRRDFSLTGALGSRGSIPLVIFQGTRDVQTPLELLGVPGAIPDGTRIVAVPGGTHADTYLMANRSIVAAIKRLLASHEPDDTSKPTPLRGAD
jgi:pimeloyl-ACP methyl ester carboxylesterase